MKPIATVTTLVLGAVAVAHALRVVFGLAFIVGSTPIPMWASVVATPIAGGLAFLLWRESRQA